MRLLLGEIPERTEFSAPAVAAPLAPYLELTAAVRSGDLAAFQQVGAGSRGGSCWGAECVET